MVSIFSNIPAEDDDASQYSSSGDENAPSPKNHGHERFDAQKLQPSSSWKLFDDYETAYPPKHSSEHVFAKDTISAADSNMSTVASALWREELNSQGELSAGAETLFRSLSDKSKAETGLGGRDQRSAGDHSTASMGRGSPGQPSRKFTTETAITYSQNEQNVTVSSLPPTLEPVPEKYLSWKSTMPHSEYTRLRSIYGEKEMNRQEVIHHLFQSETQFLRRLSVISRLFILPLRKRDSKDWIAGVPREVAKLLDWLEDIVNLHTFVLETLHKLQAREGGPMVDKVAQALRELLPRFEIYQPYLVRMEEVIGFLIEPLPATGGNTRDFSVFVAIQERAEECAGWPLEKLLKEPIVRLDEYNRIFFELKELTPTKHPDYLAALSLSHSFDLIVQVLKEVRSREDEYEMIKDIAGRMEGLTNPGLLAQRDRRLLAHGLVHRLQTIYSTDQDSQKTVPQEQVPRRNRNRLTEAIDDWDVRRQRSGSNASTTTAMSFKSFKSSKSSNTASSSVYPVSSSSGSYTSHSSGKTSVRDTDSRSSSRSGIQNLEPLHAFVFTDILLLGALVEGGPESQQIWTTVSDLGVSRVVEVVKGGEGTRDITLHLIPIASENVNARIMPGTSRIISCQLHIPEDSGANTGTAGEETWGKWFAAFEQSARFTRRALSVPSQPGHDFLCGPGSEEESSYGAVQSILASGLPMPKSPSIQLEHEHEEAEGDEVKRLEREERGWWSVRFHQVLWELQKNGIL